MKNTVCDLILGNFPKAVLSIEDLHICSSELLKKMKDQSGYAERVTVALDPTSPVPFASEAEVVAQAPVPSASDAEVVAPTLDTDNVSSSSSDAEKSTKTETLAGVETRRQRQRWIYPYNH